MNSTMDQAGTGGGGGPHIQASTATGVMAMFMTIAIGLTLSRLGTRALVHREMWWDDLSTTLACAGTITVCVLQILYIQHGGAFDADGVTDEELHRFNTAFLSTQITVRGSLCFARLSILLLYLRAFFPARAAKDGFWWAIQATIGFNIVYSVVHILVLCLQCVKHHETWGNVCMHETRLLVVASCMNIMSEMLVIAIPIGAVCKLHLSSDKKRGLLSVFSFGALAPAVSICRLVYQVKHFDTEEQAVIYATTIILATAELVIAIISGCLPVLGILCSRRRRQDRPARARDHQLRSPEPQPQPQPQPPRARRESRAKRNSGHPPFVPMGFRSDSPRPAVPDYRYQMWWWSPQRSVSREDIELANV